MTIHSARKLFSSENSMLWYAPPQLTISSATLQKHRPSNGQCTAYSTWLYVPAVPVLREVGYLLLNDIEELMRACGRKSCHTSLEMYFHLQLLFSSLYTTMCTTEIPTIPPLLVVWCTEFGVLTQGRWGSVWGCHKTAAHRSDRIIIYYSKHNCNTWIGCIFEGIMEAWISKRKWRLLTYRSIIDYYSKLSSEVINAVLMCFCFHKQWLFINSAINMISSEAY